MSIIEKVAELNRRVSQIPDDKFDYAPYNPIIDPIILKRHLLMGKWSLLHFSVPSYGLATDAIRIVPWLPSEQWSVGYTMNNYLESSFGYLSLKHWMVGRVMDGLVNGLKRCQNYKNNWYTFEEVRYPLFELFDNLEGFEFIKEWVFHEENWPKVLAKDMSEKESFDRIKNISTLLDKSNGNNLRFQLIESYKDDKFLPEVPTVDLGIHEERILGSIANRAAFRVFDEPFEKIERLLIQSVFFAHGFGIESHQMKEIPSAIATDSSILFDALEFLFEPVKDGSKISEELKLMPEFRIAEMLNEKKHSYNGITHMEVAALMDDQYNDPKKSWKYLQAASYWVGKNMPEAQGTVLAAAIHLCEKHGWTEALEVLEYNKKIMES